MLVNSYDTMLTNQEANDIFGGVTLFDSDASLTALFRAITIKYNQDKPIAEIIEKSRIAKYTVYDESDVEYVFDAYTYPITLCEVAGIFGNINPQVDGWITYDGTPYHLNRYFSQITKTKVYTNAEQKRVVALVDKRITHTWIQAFESMLWAMLSWYYPTRTDEAVTFFKRLAVGNKNVSDAEARNDLIEFVNKIAEQLGFEDLRLHKLLDGIADLARQSQIAAERTIIEQYLRDINSYMNNLSNLYRDLDDHNTILSGLQNAEPNNDNSMFMFFSQHKNLKVMSVSGESIKYGVDEILEYYDYDEARFLFTNKNSWAAKSYSEKHIKAFKELFLEKRGLIRVSATFILDQLKLVKPRKGEYPVNHSMPNPHIYFFACSGGNDQYYSRYAKSNEWDLAIEQSIAATKNWNVGDSIVGNKMLSWFVNNSETPCIYVSDGSPIEEFSSELKLVSFGEFMNIVDAINNQSSENNNTEVENG